MMRAKLRLRVSPAGPNREKCRKMDRLNRRHVLLAAAALGTRPTWAAAPGSPSNVAPYRARPFIHTAARIAPQPGRSHLGLSATTTRAGMPEYRAYLLNG